MRNSEVSTKSVKSMNWNIANKLSPEIRNPDTDLILAPDPSILQPRDAKPCLPGE